MSLSSRITQVVQRIAAYFTIEQSDLVASLRAGFEGELAAYRFGPHIVFLSVTIRKSDGSPLGATTSVTELGTIPAGWAPVRSATTAGKYITPGNGYSTGTLSVNGAGRLDTTGQPSGATTVTAGMLYFRT